MSGLSIAVAKGWREDFLPEQNWLRLLEQKSSTICFPFPLYRLLMQDEDAFKNELFASFDNLFMQSASYPNVFFIPYQNYAVNEAECLDKIAAFIKEYYAEKELSLFKIIVVGSSYYEYKNVDFIDFTWHHLTEQEEALRAENKALLKKSSLSLSLAENLSMDECLRAAQEFDAAGFQQWKNIKQKRNALFVLGEVTDNYQIKFDVADALRMADRAIDFMDKGFSVIFINKKDTPDDVTDFVCDFCQRNNMSFFNQKLSYRGKFADLFEREKDKNKNIYKALLALLKDGGVYVGTKGDFSYLTDAANFGIRTGVYAMQNIEDKRFDCQRLYDIALQKNYVFDMFDDKIFNHKFKTEAVVLDQMPRLK